MTNEHFTFSFQPITKAWKQNKKNKGREAKKHGHRHKYDMMT